MSLIVREVVAARSASRPVEDLQGNTVVGLVWYRDGVYSAAISDGRKVTIEGLSKAGK